MIKVDREKGICEIGGPFDEVLKDVQYVLQLSIHEEIRARRINLSMEKAAEVICSNMAQSIALIEDKVQRSLSQKARNIQVFKAERKQ